MSSEKTMMIQGFEDNLYDVQELRELIDNGLDKLIIKGPIDEADKAELVLIAEAKIIDLGGGA